MKWGGGRIIFINSKNELMPKNWMFLKNGQLKQRYKFKKRGFYEKVIIWYFSNDDDFCYRWM